MPVHPQAQALIDQFDAFGLKNLSDLPYDQLRQVTLDMSKQRPAEAVAEVRDLSIPGPAGTIPARLYRPAGSSASDVLPVVVYYHGGGWVIGSVESYDGTCAAIANRSGAAVVSVDYRLAPEHAFPAAVDDCWAATQWVAANGASLGVDASRMAIGGDSAGGNLTAVIALLARDAGAPTISLQVLIYPAVDAGMGSPSIDENAEGLLLTKQDMEWFYGHYSAGSDVADDWRMSPARAASHAGVAPAFVLTAEFDPLRDEGEAYAATLVRAGVPVQSKRYLGMIHGFFGMLGQVDDAEAAHAAVAQALKAALG